MLNILDLICDANVGFTHFNLKTFLCWENCSSTIILREDRENISSLFGSKFLKCYQLFWSQSLQSKAVLRISRGTRKLARTPHWSPGLVEVRCKLAPTLELSKILRKDW